MKTITVTDELYLALEEAANRSGQTVSDLVFEAIQVWLDDIAADEADHEKIEAARSEAAEKGSVEFETFFADLLGSQD